MKYIKILFSIFLVCCIIAALWISASASELIPLEGYTENPDAYPDNSLLESSSSSPDIVETQPASSPAIEETLPASSPVIDNTITSEPVRAVSDPVIVATLAPMTPTNTNGFQAVVLGLLGNYNPVVLEYAYTNSNGYTSYVREVQPDYSWMCSAAIFAIVLFCLFRLLGGLIKR